MSVYDSFQKHISFLKLFKFAPNYSVPLNQVYILVGILGKWLGRSNLYLVMLASLDRH